jgi:sporulation protein YlmC with PRC-barrel domain
MPGMDEGLIRPDHMIDAVLQLLDRQILDSEGAMAGKVDDVELTEDAPLQLRVTGILVGVPALLPRLGSHRETWWLEWWRRLGVTRADRTTPGRIDIARVAALGHDLELDRERDGVADLADEQAGRRRLNELLELRVSAPGDPDLGHVLDVRLSPAGPLSSGQVRVVGLVVGRTGRPGSMLGYDRSPGQGPWLLAHVVRWLHRHSTYLPLEDVEEIDWDGHEVRAHRAGRRGPA